MHDSSPPELAMLFREHMRQTSHDRRAQTADFIEALGELRRDIRILGTLALLGILALAGIQVSTPTVKLSPAVAIVEK